MSKVDYSERIPNNVGLADDRRLQRALEGWQPKFARWWDELGPAGFSGNDVYLRTAIDTSAEGWAHFDYVKMPDYRWGIFLSAPQPDRRIGFGESKGAPVWQEVPGEFRSDLRRLIVVQGDTEPARWSSSGTSATRPRRSTTCGTSSRSTSRRAATCGRWCTCCMRTSAGTAGTRLRPCWNGIRATPTTRASSTPSTRRPPTGCRSWPSPTSPTATASTSSAALAESAFDPLSRTCEFMLREEAHHMFVGATGLGRVAQRTCEVMVEHDTDDVRPYGVVDLPTLQKYINFHYAVSLDLFGAEASTNGANFYTAGLKGRFGESTYDDDHVLTSTTFACTEVVEGAIASVERPSLAVVNLQLRDAYSEDCLKGLRRWNRLIAEAGVDFELSLPHPGFNRAVGVFAPYDISPDGRVLTAAEWEAKRDEWLPTDADREYITSLMSPNFEPGRMAGWIAPPARGINTRPVEYEYVQL